MRSEGVHNPSRGKAGGGPAGRERQRSGAMAATVYLVGVLPTCKSVCQNLSQGHEKVEENAASSPREFSWAEG